MEQVSNTIEMFNQSLLLELFYFESRNTSKIAKGLFIIKLNEMLHCNFFMHISKLLYLSLPLFQIFCSRKYKLLVIVVETINYWKLCMSLDIMIKNFECARKWSKSDFFKCQKSSFLATLFHIMAIFLH